MKSYINIYQQVNRIIADYLTDDCCQPINNIAKNRIHKVRNIENRYIFNINKSEGFARTSHLPKHAHTTSAVYIMFM